jgi:hypothetical protein
MRIWVLGETPGRDEQQAGHQQHGAQHRRGDDYPHPASGGFIRAH